ncbi:hypothetical protein N7451_012195 [Penicillium sp. IBT 35674x]|nr:hypothetical protein N7451_012195 [Penicillium sp. IBT 35674x]
MPCFAITRDAGDSDASPSLQNLDFHHQESLDDKMAGDSPFSLGVKSGKSTELADWGFFRRCQSICASPLSPSESHSITMLPPDSVISPSEIMQSHVLEDAWQRQDRPSYRACTASLSPSDTWDTPDMSTTLGEHSPDTPLSSISSCSDVTSKTPNDRSSCVPSKEDSLDDRSDDCEPANQTRLVSDCYPSGKQDTVHEKSRSSVAVVILPSRSIRSKPKPVSSDISQSESSEGFDDSSDEAFTSDAIQSQFSDVEEYQFLGEKRGRTNTTASCYPQDTSLGLSASHRKSRDIVGRQFLPLRMRDRSPLFSLHSCPTMSA